MNEYLVCSIILLVYLSLSYIIDRIITIANSTIATSMLLLYLAGTYFYFEGVNKLLQYFRDKGLHIEFGHASLLLIMLMFVCYIIAFANIYLALGSRNKRSGANHVNEL